MAVNIIEKVFSDYLSFWVRDLQLIPFHQCIAWALWQGMLHIYLSALPFRAARLQKCAFRIDFVHFVRTPQRVIS
ncbi:MAG: hypothetical protein LUB61_00640, partial [Eggerthellaceae bacterium]|nr:hypothetical protein [Eggerthellaceae bacterium]